MTEPGQCKTVNSHKKFSILVIITALILFLRNMDGTLGIRGTFSHAVIKCGGDFMGEYWNNSIHNKNISV